MSELIQERPTFEKLQEEGWTVYSRIRCGCKTTMKSCKYLHHRELNDVEMIFCKNSLTLFAHKKIQ